MAALLVVAYNFNPTWRSESARASAWVDIASKYHDVTVITDAVHRADIERRGYPDVRFRYVEGIAPWRRLQKATGLPVAVKWFFRGVKRALLNEPLEQFNLIHCLTPAGIFAHNDLYKLGLPLLVGPLGGALPTPKGLNAAFREEWLRTRFRDLFYRLTKASKGLALYLARADVIVLGSGIMDDWIPTHLLTRSTRIPDAIVDTDHYRPLRKVKPRSPTSVLFAGRLVGKKGILLLVEAVQQCLESGIGDFVVKVAGDGRLRQSLTALIGRRRLGKHIVLLGQVPKDRMRAMYQESDIFCLPTLREAGGNAVLEAMACGLPVITSNYGGPAHFVTDECGIRIEVHSNEQYIKDLSEALRRLLLQPELRTCMGRASRRRAENCFSLGALERHIQELYEPFVRR